MAVSAPSLREGLAEIVGREQLVADGPALAAAGIDGIVPRYVARPGSADEAGRLLALAAAGGLAVAPRGSGSSLQMGAPPRRLDLVLDVERLRGVEEYVPEDMVATVGAGTTLGDLAAQCGPRRQRLALDPPAGDARTIGGVLATDASGPLRFRYGTARDLLLGVRFVQANGTLTWGGSKVVKSVTGYDVPKLFVGSLGTLGVIVAATLRLHPIPPASGAWLLSFADNAAAASFLAALLESSLEPERAAVLSASARRVLPWPGEGPAYLVSIASAEEVVASHGAALADLARRHGGRAEAMPTSAWRALDGALDAPVLLRLAGEIRNLMAWLDRAESLATAAGIEVAGVGQAGHGVLWLACRNVASGAQLDRDVLGPLRRELAPEGGSVVVERAPASMKAGVDVWGPIAAEPMAIIARLKQEFDPAGILNPGRFVGGL